jgi:predicted PurR-regulated permease PerM
MARKMAGSSIGSLLIMLAFVGTTTIYLLMDGTAILCRGKAILGICSRFSLRSDSIC